VAFLSSLLLCLLTLAVYGYCFLPWWTAADRSHVTMFVAGVKFSNSMILIPMIGFAAGAVGSAGLGVWMLKKGRKAKPLQGT
jgi:hypothetical protein